MALFGLPLSGAESALIGTLPGLMRGTGPSAARGQLYEGLGQAQRNAASLAASDRSNPALAMRNALLANQEMAQRTNQQAATLRAQEQLSSMGLGAQVGQALSKELQNQVMGGVQKYLLGSGAASPQTPLGSTDVAGNKSALLNKTSRPMTQQTQATAAPRVDTRPVQITSAPEPIDWSVPFDTPTVGAQPSPQAPAAPQVPAAQALAPQASPRQAQMTQSMIDSAMATINNSPLATQQVTPTQAPVRALPFDAQPAVQAYPPVTERRNGYGYSDISTDPYLASQFSVQPSRARLQREALLNNALNTINNSALARPLNIPLPNLGTGGY